jgi:formaldehyde-activating enzyme
VLTAVKMGDLEEARRLQSSVQKLSRIICRYGGGVAVKAALRMMGFRVGRPRLPLKPVGGALLHEDRAEIQLELEKIGKIEPADVAFHVPSGPLEGRFEAVGLDAATVRDAGLRLGSGTSGEALNSVQMDVLAGPKTGPLGDAYAFQLTYPRHSFEALTTILEPNLTVRPATLIIPANELKNLRQANMVYGPTQAAVARAIVDHLELGTIPDAAMDEEIVIVQAAIHPRALDRHALYQSVLAAAGQAIGQAYGRR